MASLGSARSIEAVNVRRGRSSWSLCSFGGHAGAARWLLKQINWRSFADILTAYILDNDLDLTETALYLNEELHLPELTPWPQKFWETGSFWYEAAFYLKGL